MWVVLALPQAVKPYTSITITCLARFALDLFPVHCSNTLSLYPDRNWGHTSVMNHSKQREAAVMPVHDHDAYDGDEWKEFKFDGTIPTKYRGTSSDQRDMVVLGKKQVLRVSHLCKRLGLIL